MPTAWYGTETCARADTLEVHFASVLRIVHVYPCCTGVFENKMSIKTGAGAGAFGASSVSVACRSVC